ncbi:MAG: antitoxin [Campylobacterota bacterium]|nr:antitoxin [Campylobacterota bacterium]
METKYIDDEEKILMESLDDIDLDSIKNDTDNIKLLQSSAKVFVKQKETKMNIRISSSELDKIKQRAELEGLKYQTFVKSILHKYITGQLTDKRIAIV